MRKFLFLRFEFGFGLNASGIFNIPSTLRAYLSHSKV